MALNFIEDRAGAQQQQMIDCCYAAGRVDAGGVKTHHRQDPQHLVAPSSTRPTGEMFKPTFTPMSDPKPNSHFDNLITKLNLK